MIETFLFLLYVVGFVFLPGRQTVEYLEQTEKRSRFFLDLGVGLAQLVTVAYLGRLVGAWWLVWGLVGWGLLGARSFWQEVKLFRKIKADWLTLGLICLAICFQLLVMVKSGTAYQGGLAFWGVHGHDGIWHLALIQELAQHWPPQNPGFAGETLQNYHYFFDLLGAEVYRVTRINLADLYFRFLPFLLALVANGLVFGLGKDLTKSRPGGRWAVFFFAFGSSLGFVLPWLGKGSANWETAFWAMQPSTSLQNPPFYFSLVLILAGLAILTWWGEKPRRLNLWLPALLFGLLAVTKVYGWLVILAALGGLGTWEIFKHRKREYFQLFAQTLLISGLFYLQANNEGTGLIKWNPGWFLKTMFEAPDRLNWSVMEIRRQVWVQSGRWGWASLMMVLGGLIFLVGNFGTRLLAFWCRKRQEKSLVEKILWLVVLFGFIPAMLFTQEYVAWNTIQFFYYSIFALGLLAASGTELLLKKVKTKGVRILLIVLLIFFSVPGSLKTVSWHLGKVPAAWVSDQELAAFEYLRTHSSAEAVVLVYPHRYEQEEKRPVPAPLADYNTAYVAYLANRRVYLEDETAALIQGYDYNARRLSAVGFFTTLDAQAATDFLRLAGIDYLYLVDDLLWTADLAGVLEPVFVNQEATVWAVQR